MSTAKQRLESLGLELPNAATPAANYVPFQMMGDMIYISGQLPFKEGDITYAIGKIGQDFSVDQGQEFAKYCALNLLAQAAKANDGSLEGLQCVKLGVFVNSVLDFTEHPAVANGASNIMVDVLGDVGRHARFAVGVSSLPRGVAVEIDGLFKIS